MKIVGIRDAKTSLSEYVGLSQKERVIVTNHGKPVALVVGLKGYDLEDVVTASDPEFWKMIEKRRKQPTVSSKELRRSLGLPPRQARRIAGSK